MNQEIQKVNPKFYKNKWRVFTLCHISVFFIFTLWVLGSSLWFQAFLISVFTSGLLFFIFLKTLNQLFKTKEIKGYDPWHLQPLLKQKIWKTLPSCRVFITENETPFCFFYDFFSPCIILSSSFLKNFQEKEFHLLFNFLEFNFKNKGAQNLTQITYVMAVLFSPFLGLQWIFKKLHLYFLDRLILIFFRYVFYRLFEPWVCYLIHSLDRKFISQGLDQNSWGLFLRKLQSYFEHSKLNRHPLWSLLFPTNPLTLLSSYSTLQPSVTTRMRRFKNYEYQ